MADIFKEVDEELRHERYAKLWKKYGMYVITAAVLVVGAVAGTSIWRDYQISAREADGEAFAAALSTFESGDNAAAANAFAALAESAGGGYAVLARLQAALALGRSGDAQAAAAAFEGVAADSSADPLFRDLAVLLLAIETLDTADPASLTARLQPLAAATSPWRHTARELTALLAIRAGEPVRARELLTTLSDDDEAPIGIRGRATELLATLGG
jgi:hypothetical protein